MKKSLLMNRSFLLLFIALCGWTTAYTQLERDSVNIILDYQRLQNVKLADLDNDGDVDIMGSRTGFNGHLSLYKQLNDSVHFAPPVTFGDTTWENYPQVRLNYELGDMDNDGDIDIVSHNYVRNSHPFWSNDGTGNFNPPPNTGTTLNPIGYNFFFRIVDLNSDGWQDILIYLYGAHVLAVNWNTGVNGTFIYEVLEEVEPPHDLQFLDLTISDYDQDGDIDLGFVIAQYGYTIDDPKELWYHQFEQTCPTCFSEVSQQLLAYAEGGFVSTQTSIADFDQDGWPDISIGFGGIIEQSGESNNTLLFLRNQAGSGIFSQALELENYRQNQVADINQDGAPDLFVIHDDDASYQNGGNNSEEYSNQWLRNTGNFTFEPVVIDDIWTERTILASDLNQDGLIDLITPNDEISWRPALSPGTFGAPQEMDILLFHIDAFTTMDWDEDGDLDIIVADDQFFTECCQDAFFLLENTDGLGHFGPPIKLFSTNGNLRSLAFVDLDNDDRIDIAGFVTVNIGNQQTTQGFYWLSDPENPATEATLMEGLTSGLWNDYLHAGDINADGFVDLISLNSDGDVSVVYNNLVNTGTFDYQDALLPNPSYISNIVFMDYRDLDQDEDGDVIYGTRDSIYCAIHEDGAGTFGDWQSIPATSNQYYPLVLIEDFDGDGDLDLKYQSRSQANVNSWVFAAFDSEANTFQAPQIVEWNATFTSGHEFVLSLNDDSTPDILSSAGFMTSIPGTGYHTTPFLPTPFEDWLPTRFFWRGQVADINGDGEEEIISGFRELVWYNKTFVPTDRLEGLLLRDNSLLCTFDSLNPGLKGWNILVESDDQQQIASTNVDGHYASLLPTADEHLITPVPLSSYWTVCQTDSLLLAPLADETTVINFSAIANTDCPLLQVDMTVSPIRQCFNSHVAINYHNVGTLPVADASITVYFDPRFTPTSSSQDWDMASDTSITFLFPEIGVGDLGSIYIAFEPDCENLQLDEIICFRTEVLPDDLCQNALSSWEGAQLEAEAFCEGDSLAFRVFNSGDGPMPTPQPYRLDIVNDDIVLFMIDNTQLPPGEADTIRVGLAGQTFRFSIDQPEGHPFPEPVSLVASSCDLLDSLDHTSLQFTVPNNEGNPFIIERCGPVIGPYDPNIKVGLPHGVGDENWIAKEWPLDYTIHFQNTGSDFALNVVLRDTLSEHLDLCTFRPGPSSHEHEWIILPDRQLIVTFPNIMLPDSTANEPESHGFFSYRIAPLETAPPLTVIDNRAGIYFDFNDPIITNTTTHIIQKPRVETVQQVSICAGEEYLNQVLVQDTILQELVSTPDLDSIIWYYVDVLPTSQTEILITLEEPGEWEGISINQDTSIVFFETNSVGCDSLVIYQLTVLTATEAPDWVDEWKIGPNPVEDILQLSRTSPLAESAMVRLVHPSGRQVLESALAAGSLSKSIPLRHLPSGIYYLEIRQDETLYRWPISKQ